MSRNKLGGVCAGFADFFGMDITMFRLGFVLSVIFAGVPIILYIVAWIVMPRNDMPRNDNRRVEVRL